MIIATEKKIRMEFAMTKDEIETLKYTWTILAQIGNTLGTEGNEWVSPTTGEVVGVDEFARVLGILSAFAEQEVWEMVEEQSSIIFFIIFVLVKTFTSARPLNIFLTLQILSSVL